MLTMLFFFWSQTTVLSDKKKIPPQALMWTIVMTNCSCNTACDCSVSMCLPSASCSVMSGLARSCYRPVSVEQQMVDHSRKMGEGGAKEEEEENKQTTEYKLCSEKLHALCELGSLWFVLLLLETKNPIWLKSFMQTHKMTDTKVPTKVTNFASIRAHQKTKKTN